MERRTKVELFEQIRRYEFGIGMIRGVAHKLGYIGEAENVILAWPIGIAKTMLAIRLASRPPGGASVCSPHAPPMWCRASRRPDERWLTALRQRYQKVALLVGRLLSAVAVGHV
jgi:hypothetical protein